MKKCIKEICNFINEKINIVKKQKEIFEKIQAGEMIWAQMPLNKKELSEIEESHRIRPYLVVKKEKNFIFCYQSSSKSRKQYNNYEEYCLNKLKYKNKKDSWLDLKSIKRIEIKNIKGNYIKLKEIDIKRIEKRICIEQNRGNSETIKFNKTIYIEIGDVILYNEKLYYVYSEDNVNIYCFEIHKRKKENVIEENIIINRKTYYTNFKELKAINRKDKMEINNIAYKDEVLEILKKKRELKRIYKSIRKMIYSTIIQ